MVARMTTIAVRPADAAAEKGDFSWDGRLYLSPKAA